MAHTNSTANYNLPQFLSTDKPAWLTDINNAFYDIDAALKANADAALPATILDAMHPVGSEYVTQSNTAPAIGGTWVLVEKELANLHESLPSAAYTAQGSTIVDSITMRRSGSEIQLRFAFSNVSISETQVNLVQLDLNELGVSQLGSGVTYATAYSDTGNVLVNYMLGTDGMLSCVDCVCFASGTYTHAYTGGLTAFSIPVVLTSDHLLNAACDRFVWKRTA